MREFKCPTCHRKHQLEPGGADRHHRFSCACGTVLDVMVCSNPFNDRIAAVTPAAPRGPVDPQQARAIGRELERREGG